ncbi:MAG TPA: FAD-dependent oxidoreductase [Spirochaetales bacterium]|nr:FAD-dependent oxidoreductase [Spirochaetales bacterium]
MKTTHERVAELVESVGTWYEKPGCLASGRMTAELYPYTSMFSPIRVNRLTIKNRLVMAPMGNVSMADETGRPSAKMIEYFTARARGGVGLITSGLVPVSHGVDPTVTELGDLSYFPRIDRSRSVFAGWRDLAERCHAHGARFFIQLTPGLGRVGSPECLINKKKLPVSASWNPNFYMPALPCRPLTDGQASRIIKNSGQAAADAKAATIDGVYLHGHEGYLLEQMTNPAFNRRKLGAFADWQAFGVKMIEEIRRRVGPDYPIMYRIDLSLALEETYGERMDAVPSLKKFKGGRTPEQTLEYMESLVKAGVDLFDVDLGCYDNWWLPHPPSSMAPGCYLDVSRIVKERFAERKLLSNAGLPVPVVAVGKLGYPDLSEKALRDGDCDMVMLGRPLLADPEWPNKAFAGRVADIAPCIGDQEGCINEFVEGGHPQCAVNARTGFEDILDGSELAPAAVSKKIAVVGSGPGGMQCAVIAARRGHDVTLYESRVELGGMLVPGSRPAIKFDIVNYLEKLRHDVKTAGKDYKLKVKLGEAPSAAELKRGKYDAIVTATGSVQAKPPVPGIDSANVRLAVDVLRDPSLASGAQKIVVVGGGVVGCETAYWLAHELGKDVAIVEMLPAFMKGVCTANRGWLLHYLEERGVALYNCSRLAEVRPGSVTIRRNVHRSVPDPTVTWTPLLPENVENPFAPRIKSEERDEELPADLVLLAAGARPDDRLYRACVEAGAAPDIRNLGDSFSMGRVLEATRAAYAVGTAL